MFFTPNELKWPVCPECNILINTWDGIPMEALGNRYFLRMTCPSPKCKKDFIIRIRVIFKAETEKIED